MYNKNIRILIKENEIKYPQIKKIDFISTKPYKMQLKILFCKFQTIDEKFNKNNEYKLKFSHLSKLFESEYGFDYNLHIEDFKYKNTVYTCIFPKIDIILKNKNDRYKDIKYFIPEMYDIGKNIKIDLLNLDIFMQISFLK